MGALYCAAWKWEKFPKAIHGIHAGEKGYATIWMEVICSIAPWIWHLHAGLPGSLNDINILDTSPFFADVLNNGTAAEPKQI